MGFPRIVCLTLWLPLANLLVHEVTPNRSYLLYKWSGYNSALFIHCQMAYSRLAS